MYHQWRSGSKRQERDYVREEEGKNDLVWTMYGRIYGFDESNGS